MIAPFWLETSGVNVTIPVFGSYVADPDTFICSLKLSFVTVTVFAETFVTDTGVAKLLTVAILVKFLSFGASEVLVVLVDDADELTELVTVSCFSTFSDDDKFFGVVEVKFLLVDVCSFDVEVFSFVELVISEVLTWLLIVFVSLDPELSSEISIVSSLSVDSSDSEVNCTDSLWFISDVSVVTIDFELIFSEVVIVVEF
ncbi:Uncharacterised protein [Mammaliicoccus stepanovicii]|uniref:Uncharacterized protein n=1 Tax=Mammaliicoccus stepanovicii TaxID=643214 RepID=A0A239Y8B9_9STAP|nr:Uncharacterised protein [Mammaliicoccus stepanovicii]